MEKTREVRVSFNEENEINAKMETYDDAHFDSEPWQLDRMNKIVEQCKKNKPPNAIILDSDAEIKVLDVASADGYLSNRLKLEGYDVTSVDLSPTRLKRMREIYGLNGVLADIRELPFEDNSFDIVIAAEILEHLPEMWRGMKEIERVCKQNGLLIITMPVGEEHDNFKLHKWAIRKQDVEWKNRPDMCVFSIKRINR